MDGVGIVVSLPQPLEAMDRKPLVSTIIPFFNAEKFLPEAIESVFAQTYENWELLLVDDGSSDGSTEIALQHAEQYPEKDTLSRP